MLEKVILENLLYNEEYTRKVLPYLKDEYFSENQGDRLLFQIVFEYIQKYNARPSKEAIAIDLTNRKGIPEYIFKGAVDALEHLETNELELAWLLDTTEKFCQEKAIHNALYAAVDIIKDSKTKDKGSIPQMLQDALAISFDTHIGHDFIDDVEERWDLYHTNCKRVPFHIDYLDRITKGGLPDATLTILMGGIHAGKSLVMCSMAADNLLAGFNVLYISMEMSEAAPPSIAERIDANLMNLAIDEMKNLPKDMFLKKMERIKLKTTGKLVIKQFPGGTAGADNFRHLLQELKIKKNFIPDIIYIDYLNICKSSRLKYSAMSDLYLYIKTIAEELRGLAVEMGLPIVSATQLNRGGFTSTDPGMDDTSESFGLPATCDLMLAIVNNDDMRKLNQVMFKQLKNRLGNINLDTKFFVGVDTLKFRLYDIEQEPEVKYTPSPKNDKMKEKFVTEEMEVELQKPEKRDKFDRSVFKDFK